MGNDQFIWRNLPVLLRSLLSGDLRSFLIALCLMLPAVVICLTVHECAHGLAAPSNPLYLPQAALRECAAIVKDALVGNI